MNSQLELFTNDPLPRPGPLYADGQEVVFTRATGYQPERLIVEDSLFNAHVGNPRWFYTLKYPSDPAYRLIGASESQMSPVHESALPLQTYNRHLAMAARAHFHSLGKWMDQKSPTARRAWQDARSKADALDRASAA